LRNETQEADRRTRGTGPSWDLSQHTLDLLLKHGFTYESSLMGDDYTPYRCRQGDIVDIDKPLIFGKPTRLIEMPIA
jgi:hypothetical protein